MAHKEQAYFCEQVRNLHPRYFYNTFVVDIGSLDINGSNRELFSDCLYLGVDLSIGKNVDLICKGHELGLPDESVDVIISTEVFEHDIHYPETIQNIIRMLKPGGLFLFTCATTGRPEHGTKATTIQDAPFLEDAGWPDYYKNLTEADIEKVVNLKSVFSEYQFSVNHSTHDLYFWGIKRGQPRFRDNYSFLVWESRVERDSIRTKVRNSELEKQVEDLTTALTESTNLIDHLQSQQKPYGSGQFNFNEDVICSPLSFSSLLSGKEGEWHSFNQLKVTRTLKNKIVTRFGLIHSWKLKKHKELIQNSIFFDAEWYRWAYSDIERSDVDPATHFLEHGATEGRNPSPYFDTKFYCYQNPDVSLSGINPLVHYILYGILEGRVASPIVRIDTKTQDIQAKGQSFQSSLHFDLGTMSLVAPQKNLTQKISETVELIKILAEIEYES
ncbi:class I SAM-dependent methyltransferase [Aurantimicrobium minutum]|uniref:RTX toxins and related Ca2+-binding protein n=1 Tax=Aurantimicrobium minutum TaxID=708131 RepID=A0A173LV64_9MICO|nr:class I SAM-dependent methyltransferase [Aurantimicrobium minutum]BAU98720.1 RTX toxins and related Ca2+-binding protein [Aurantimicrobium minutum]